MIDLCEFCYGTGEWVRVDWTHPKNPTESLEGCPKCGATGRKLARPIVDKSEKLSAQALEMAVNAFERVFRS